MNNKKIKKAAKKIYGYVDMYVASELPEKEMLKEIENALIEVNDEDFVDRVLKASDEEYMELEIPDNETLKYVVDNGQGGSVWDDFF